MASDGPASYLTLERGADVISADGERVGTVEHVLRDESTDIFDGIVIDVRTGPVTIAVAAADVEKLPKPSANPAVMEHHGVEDSESPLEHKLRRAWEIISGRG